MQWVIKGMNPHCNNMTALKMGGIMWQTKYMDHEFAYLFASEREYIDSAFIMMIMFNFGVWIERENLLDELAICIRDEA
jgi:hypothetical protein